MLVLQIFLIPLVVLILLGGVVAIGSQGTVLPRDINQTDPDAYWVNNPYLIQIANSSLPATMISSGEPAKPVTTTTVTAMNSNEFQLSSRASKLEIETLETFFYSE